jgi:hypothetical protein
MMKGGRLTEENWILNGINGVPSSPILPSLNSNWIECPFSTNFDHISFPFFPILCGFIPREVLGTFLRKGTKIMEAYSNANCFKLGQGNNCENIYFLALNWLA